MELSNEFIDGQEDNRVDRMEIEYFTDPLCCWSWAFEPVWRRFLQEFKGRVTWKYRMGGMIPDWKSYNDPLNDVSRPAHLGPLWMQVRQLTGAPTDEAIWMEDPPQSSYPACMAVKCAELQSKYAADAYLHFLREAVMKNRKNIEKREVLIEVAKAVELKYPYLLDAALLESDITLNHGLESFKEDLKIVKYRNIGRFPSLTIRRPADRGILLIGYRPYPALLEALKQLDIEPTKNEKTSS